MSPSHVDLERESHPKLNLPLRERRSETQRLARRERCAAMHVERGESRRQAEEWAGHVVYTGIVCMVRDVEALSRKLQLRLLANFMLPTQAHIETDVARAKPGVATGSDRTLIGGVIVAVHLTSSQQVERMSAVIGKSRRQLKARKGWILPRAVKHSGHYDFMALIEFRKSAIRAQVRRILRSIIAVEIRRGVEALAKSVVAQQSKVIAEALLEF